MIRPRSPALRQVLPTPMRAVPESSWRPLAIAAVLVVASSAIVALALADSPMWLPVGVVLGAIVASIVGRSLVVGPLRSRLAEARTPARRPEAGDRPDPGSGADPRGEREWRDRVEATLRHRATHDDLTGVFNRQYATDVLSPLFDRHGIDDAPVTLLFCDLDGFKAVNDDHGHGIGDRVLIAVAGRLDGAIDQSAILARWGGDEFLVGLVGVPLEVGRSVADRIRRSLDEPIVVDGRAHELGVSVGVAAARVGASFDEVLHDADARMFDDKMRRRPTAAADSSAQRLVLSALADDRVEVWYQTLVRLRRGRPEVVGVEALARLALVDGRVVAPAEFIADIDGVPAARDLDRLVVARAVADLSRWSALGLVPDAFRLALNVSSASTCDDGFAGFLAEQVVSYGLRPDRLALDLGVHAASPSPEVVTRLRGLGVVLVVDGLGSGRSNVDRLVDLHAGMAKLDRRWLGERDVVGDDDRRMIQTLVRLCGAMGVPVLASGVETRAQLETLVGLGITDFQGHLFGVPCPAAELERRFGVDAVTWLAVPHTDDAAPTVTRLA